MAIDGRTWRAVLAAGDVLVLALFIVLGRISHGMAVADVTLWTTVVPFAAAWLATSALVGASSARAFSKPGILVLRTTAAWAVACPLGVALRAVILQRPFSPIFAAIAFVLTWPLLIVWRYLYFRLTARRQRPAGSGCRA